MTISAHSLTMAVLAVDARINELKKQIAGSRDPDLSELEQQLFSYSKAEMELKRMHVQMHKASDNLPPYEELVE